MKKLAKILCFALVAGVLAAFPTVSRADDTTNSATATPPKKHGLPFHGKVASVDTSAMTFTVGTMTIAMGSATKVMKDGQPATFSDITVGEMISGSYKKDADGKLSATSVRIGAKMKKTETPSTGTNAPPTK